MLTIKVFLSDSGRIANLKKDFPLYQGQYQDKLLDVYVPTSILAPDFSLDSYIGQTSGSTTPSDATLTQFTKDIKAQKGLEDTNPQVGDVVFYARTTSPTYTYYKCVCATAGASAAWTSTSVNYLQFASPFQTAIKIACISKKSNGEQYKSASRSMRFIKNTTIDGIEYALYERKLPKEFTTYYGASAQAPTMIINVVNIDTAEDDIFSIVTSQTCTFDVLPSAIIDNDSPVPASELEEITATLNTLTSQMASKQNIIDSTLNAPSTTPASSRTVVGAINNIDGRVTTNAEDIGEIEEDVTDLQDRVETLETIIGSGEKYIDTKEVAQANFPPSASEFLAWSRTKLADPTYVQQGGDVFIVIETISGATDKTFKFIYNGTSWIDYEIPPIEKAGNGSLGIVKGTYNDANYSNDNIRANIVDGVINKLQTKDINGTTKDVKAYLNALETSTNTNASDIDKIENGTTIVKKAEQDKNGNDIVATYMTQSNGATKQYVKDYALPKDFNVARFLNSDLDEWTSTPEEQNIVSITSSSTGYHTIYDAIWTLDKDIQIANKNGFATRLYMTANRTHAIRFNVTTYIRENSSASWTQASSEISNLISFTKNQNQEIYLDYPFEDLTTYYNLTSGGQIRQKVEIFATESTSTIYKIYTGFRTRFYLNTMSYSIVESTAPAGYVPYANVINSTISGDNLILTFDPSIALSDHTELYIYVPNAYGSDIASNPTKNIYLSQDGTAQYILQTYNWGNVKGSDMRIFRYDNNNANIYFFKVYYDATNSYMHASALNLKDYSSKDYVDAQDNAFVGKITPISATASYSNHIISATLPSALDSGKEYKFTFTLSLSETTFTDEDEFILYDTSSNPIQLTSTTNVNPDVTMVGSEFEQFAHYTSGEGYRFDFIGIYYETTTLGTTTRYIYVDKVVNIDVDLSSKQDTLVSGTNIKTINSQSILGSGNLNVSGVPSGGTQGQSLVKHSNTDYDVEWSNVVAGGEYDAQNECIGFESATPSVYTAGAGIDITNNEISIDGVDTATSGQVLVADGNGSSEWGTMIAGAEVDANNLLTFKSASASGVNSIGGASGVITLGTGLTMSNNELSASGGGTTLNKYTYSVTNSNSSRMRMYNILLNAKGKTTVINSWYRMPMAFAKYDTNTVNLCGFRFSSTTDGWYVHFQINSSGAIQYDSFLITYNNGTFTGAEYSASQATFEIEYYNDTEILS